MQSGQVRPHWDDLSKNMREAGTQSHGDPHITHSRSSAPELAMCLARPKWWARGQRKLRREERQRTDTVGLAGFSKDFGFYWRQPSVFNALFYFQLYHTTYVVASVEMDLLRVKSRSRGIIQEAIAVIQLSLDRAWIRVVITGEGRNIRFCIFLGSDQLNSPID